MTECEVEIIYSSARKQFRLDVLPNSESDSYGW